MYNKNIIKYLNKVNTGQAFNYPAFLKLLPEALREEVEHHAIATSAKGGHFQVDISCNNLIARITELTQAPQDRTDASIKGDSHKKNTSVSFMLAFHEKCHDIHPETIIISQQKIHCLFTPKKQVLIIENAELFFAKDMLLAQINKVFGMKLSFAETDIIYGAGNQISHQLNTEFLQQYQSVLCFFDYDLGGLKIFKAIKNMVGNRAKFLEPSTDNLAPYFIKKPKTNEHYLSALSQAKSLGLMALHSNLLAKAAFMEQEVILAFE